MNIGLPTDRQSDNLTFGRRAKAKITFGRRRKTKSLSAETENKPKVNFSLSAETENRPKLVKWQLSAPKPKPKPKFGRSLILM